MSPKSLLRHKLSTTPIENILTGKFQTVIDETDNLDKAQVTRLLFCCGKVYYDLLESRKENNHDKLVPYGANTASKIYQGNN